MRRFLLGNEALALGALIAGVRFATSYPGTPASEILPAFFKFCREFDIKAEGGWMINEKVALEAAYFASISGIKSMCSMKQVGLNVASDPVMSAAYTGVKESFLIAVADDPGPASSQTEQDTRFFAQFAKIPVFDPSNPQDVLDLTIIAANISKEFEIPVIIREVLKVAHARQSVSIKKTPQKKEINAEFIKEPERWAATPKFRYKLHKELNEKINEIKKINRRIIEERLNKIGNSSVLFIASGAMFSYAKDLGFEPILKIDMPFPIDESLLNDIARSFSTIWVLEETYPVIEMQFPCRENVKGKLSKDIPSEGDISPDLLEAKIKGKKFIMPNAKELKPRLCPGCGHRSVFFAIKSLFPKGIYPGDIGCYTLGINLNAVDTCLCMGASFSAAIGIAKSYELSGKEIPVIATIGDSTFFHSGIPALIEAKEKKAKAIFAILDNKTTAMTGGQPVVNVNMENIIKACGINFVEKAFSYDYDAVKHILKKAWDHSKKNSEPAVIIFETPCVIYGSNKEYLNKKVYIEESLCVNCGICYNRFECPAIYEKNEKAFIDEFVCNGCGVCCQICPYNAINIEG